MCLLRFNSECVRHADEAVCLYKEHVTLIGKIYYFVNKKS